MSAFSKWSMEQVQAHNRKVAMDMILYSQRDSADLYESSLRKQAVITPITNTKPKSLIPTPGKAAGWCTIGGKKFYSRSKWERNYAHYLQFLKEHGQIKDWCYEPKTFWFEGVRRGANNYKPDFLVIHPDDMEEYREVKGWMNSRSRTKLKRMKKYFPDVHIRVIDGAWFKHNGRSLSFVVPNWEK